MYQQRQTYKGNNPIVTSSKIPHKKR